MGEKQDETWEITLFCPYRKQCNFTFLIDCSSFTHCKVYDSFLKKDIEIEKIKKENKQIKSNITEYCNNHKISTDEFYNVED